MGKNYKRKTRWRTLNIADYPSTPAGEEDDEDGIRKSRENGMRKGQSTHKSVHVKAEQKNENGIGNGIGIGKKDSNDRASSPSRSSQPKIIFDENEYTRITTPRQDVLFKKGYLAKKKVWSCNNASTSATPSTTESQSASHSTADGSETTEDPQLLDYRDNNIEEFQSHIEPAAQMSYGTFYDHTSGYYYEYPIMVVGPPIPGPPIHNVLATIPCEPVPLRPIEWINPAFVPKLDETHCLINYQNTPVDQQFATTLDENGMPLVTSNGDNNATSWTGSVTGEEQLNDDDDDVNDNNNDDDDQVQQQSDEKNDDVSLKQQSPEQNEEIKKENGEEEEGEGEEVEKEQFTEQLNQPDIQNYSQEIVNSHYPNEHCLETVLAQQLHVSHHVIPSGPQPYMYPGHYMFGPTLINLNGMTIQSGPMLRTTEMTAPSVFARRKKKKKLNRRKARRIINSENNGDYGQEEEEDYSSETDISNQNPVEKKNFTSKNSRPLNPNCKEFVLKSNCNSNNESTTATVTNGELISSSSSSLSPPPPPPPSLPPPTPPSSLLGLDSENHKNKPSSDINVANHIDSIPPKDVCESPVEFPAMINNIEYATEATINDTNGISDEVVENNNETELGVDVICVEFNEIIERLDNDKPTSEVILTNGNNDDHHSSFDDTDTFIRTNELQDKSSINSNSNSNYSNQIQMKNLKKKYKNPKVVREVTPGPNLKEQSQHSTPLKSQTESETEIESKKDNDEQVLMGIDAIEAQLSDSGFESQTRLSDYPITEAVTEWLQRANSPELFKSNVFKRGEESESEEDDDLEDRKPPKNLVGNPMPALSVNNVTTLLNEKNCGEFAKSNNISQNNNNSNYFNKQKKNKKKILKKMGNKRKNGNNKQINNKQQSNKQIPEQIHLINNNNNNEQNLIGICEFTEKDSNAGMRVAVCSRINSSSSSSSSLLSSPASLTINKNNNYNNDETIANDERKSSLNLKNNHINLNNVKTYERGEIVVSFDGVLIPKTIYSKLDNDIKLDGIEEPDILDCWEIEKLNTAMNIKQCNELDNDDNHSNINSINLDIVRKYYKLGRDSVQSISSIEDTISESKSINNDIKFDLNSPQDITKYKNNNTLVNNIDEGIEVYESYYNGKLPIIFDNFKGKSVNEDGPIPCKAACCIVQ